MKAHDHQEGETMERPDDVMFSGAKVGKDTPPNERRRTPRPRANKPPRPSPPPQTDNQRREEMASGTRNPYQERNDLPGSGRTRRGRAQSRRDRMAARRESRDNFASRQNAPAPAPAPTQAENRPRRRRLRPKPQRPS